MISAKDAYIKTQSAIDSHNLQKELFEIEVKIRSAISDGLYAINVYNTVLSQQTVMQLERLGYKVSIFPSTPICENICSISWRD